MKTIAVSSEYGIGVRKNFLMSIDVIRLDKIVIIGGIYTDGFNLAFDITTEYGDVIEIFFNKKEKRPEVEKQRDFLIEEVIRNTNIDSTCFQK